MGAVDKLTPELRALLSEPGAIVIDESDTERLAVRGVGDAAEVNGVRVRVVGLTRGLKSLAGPYVFCSITTARRLLRLLPDQVTYVLGKCRNAEDAPRVARRLQDEYRNISAFTARCAASAGASPYDVVSAALATLKGHRHGGATRRFLALVRQCDTPKRARSAIADLLRRGETVPGFGHPLYPAGDPRAVALLRLADASGNAATLKPFRNLITAGSELLREEPNLDAGLVAVSRAYRLPDDAPFMLFTLGRTIGWIAHAIEEYASGRLIRPRARYVGPAPN